MDDVDRLWVGRAVERWMPVDPDVAFALLTEIAALPSWNACIAEVLRSPDSLAAGQRWTVRMQVGKKQWASASVVALHDQRARRFSYHSLVDGGEGSYTEWRWHVAAHADGCLVSVGWVSRPARPLRFAGLVRDRVLRGEVTTSLARLEHLAMTPPLTASSPARVLAASTLRG